MQKLTLKWVIISNFFVCLSVYFSTLSFSKATKFCLPQMPSPADFSTLSFSLFYSKRGVFVSDVMQFLPNMLDDSTVNMLCAEYGIWGRVITENNPYTNRTDMYIVASLKDISEESIDYEKIINRNAQHSNLFFPQNFAFKVDETNTLSALESLVDYCKKAEFISAIYKEFNAPLPDKMQLAEVYYLIDFNEGRYNDKLPQQTRNKYLTGLKNYFKDERKDSTFHKQWRSYTRSEKYDDKASKFKQFIGFLNRNEPETDINSLLKAGGELRKLEMQEHEYVKFREFMVDCFPDVVYTVGDKTIIDHGLIDTKDDDLNMSLDTPWGICVTGKKYAELVEDYLAVYGVSFIKRFTPSYWEYRDVYYKACDEQKVARAYNSINLAYAKCDSLETIKEKGNPVLVDIPTGNFMNFVALSKGFGLHFYVDNQGHYAPPSLELVRVIYPDTEHHLLAEVMGHIVTNQILRSHVTTEEQSQFTPKVSLDKRITNASNFKSLVCGKNMEHNVKDSSRKEINL